MGGRLARGSWSVRGAPVLAIAAFLVSGCAAPEWVERFRPGAAGAALRQGIEQFNGGDFRAARPLLEQGLRENPSDSAAHLYMGLACIKTRESQAARAHLEKALVLSPRNERIHFYLSELARERRDFPGAEQHLRSAFAISPRNFAILNNLGLVSCEQKKFKEAIGFYSQALEQNRSSFITFYNLGEAYRKSEQYSSAERTFREAQKLAPDNVYLAFSLAETFYFLKKFEESARQYMRIVMSPTRFDQIGRVYFQLGVISYTENRLDEAMGHLDLSARSAYDRALVDLWRGKVEIRQKRYPQALQFLKEAEVARAKGGRGNPAQLRYYQGVALLNMERIDDAIPLLRGALLFDLPRDRIFAQLGTAYLRKALGLPSTVTAATLSVPLEQAQEFFEKCLDVDTESLVSMLGLSQVAFLRKDFEKSVTRAQEALNVSRDFAPALLQQSMAFYQLKRLPDAIGGLEACLVVEPSNTAVMFFLAQIYAQMGRYPDAESLFRKGLGMEPRNLDAMLLLSGVLAKSGRFRESGEQLQRILGGEGDVQVKKDARELYALVSKTYRDIVDLSKIKIKGQIGTMAYVEGRLNEPKVVLDRGQSAPLTSDDKTAAKDLIDRLVLDHNYLSTNNLFKTPEAQKRYAEGLRELVERLQKM